MKKKRAVSGFVLFSSAERKAMSTEKTQLGIVNLP